jgi:hypothetical protein
MKRAIPKKKKSQSEAKMPIPASENGRIENQCLKK